MSHKGESCLYDKNLIVKVFDKNKGIEERNLNITISDSKNILQIKIRDPLEYCFNYTENIDLGDFEIIRVNQNLDINFNEFKYNLIELLQQFEKKEMFLKCELSNQKCTLVFFYKSKIKAIVYLTIDLHMTNQKEIFSELINNMQNVQETNERLKKQLTIIRKLVADKDKEIQSLILLKNGLEDEFYNKLKQLNSLFNKNIEEIQTLLLKNITVNSRKVVKLSNEVNTLKRTTALKSESSKNLIKSIEALQLDANNNIALINSLKKENSALHATNFNQEKLISDLQKHLQEKESMIADLQKKNNELQSDMEKLSIVLAQKKATVDELSKDLVQANQMLVNFNNHYDNKSKQVEELQGVVAAKDASIKDLKLRSNELMREYENYKGRYNNEIQENLKHQLLLSSNKIEELEKALKKANKLNALLTEKVNDANYKPH